MGRKLERIDWLDHSSYEKETWRHLEFIVDDLTPYETTTIGFVIFENEEYLITAATIAEPRKEEKDETKCVGVQLILKSCITRRESL